VKTIPLFGSGVSSYSSVVSRQRRINCFYDIRKDQDKAGVVVVGTPGSYQWIELPTAPIYGWHVVATTLYVVAGQTLYSVSAGGGYTNVGAIPTAGQFVSMEDNGAELIIVDGVAGYVFTFASSSVTTIVDANFPNGATSVAFFNSKFYVNVPQSREFRVSNSLSGLNWTPLVFGTKENSSDLLVELDVINGALALYGQLSIEFWQDTGASPLAVSRINGATQAWGLAAPHSHVAVGNTQMFLGVSSTGGPVSDSDICSILSEFTSVYDAVALTYSVLGHSIYQLSFPSQNRTLCYDLTSGVWHEAQTGLDLVGRHHASLSVAYNNLTYVSDANTGSIYRLDLNTYTDNGEAIRRQVCTRHVYSSGDYIFLKELLLDLETGVGNVDAPDPVLMLRVSRDGGRNFGPQKSISLGSVGRYLTEISVRALGRAKDFVFMLEITDPVKFVLCSGSVRAEIPNA
jgi:hypothetical protein